MNQQERGKNVIYFVLTAIQSQIRGMKNVKSVLQVHLILEIKIEGIIQDRRICQEGIGKPYSCKLIYFGLEVSTDRDLC